MVEHSILSTSLHITHVEKADYDALAELLTACYADFVFDAEVLQAQDENDGSVAFPAQRWLARQGQTLIGCSEYRQIAQALPRIQFLINIVVHPEYRGRGFGGQMYRFLLEHLPRSLDLSLCATVHSADMHSLGFLQRRRFVTEQSVQEWELSLAKVDVEMLPFCDGKFTNLPLTICTVAELTNDPARNRKLHRLIGEIRKDTLSMPASELFSYETFEADYLAQPSFFPELAFVAIHDGEYIGYSDLRDDGADGLLSNLTGVLRNYRRQGLATALKIHGLRCAQERGYTRVRTFCTAENTAIQALNEKLGFVKMSAWTRVCNDDFHAPIKDSVQSRI